MRKIKTFLKKNYKLLIGFIIGVLVFGSIVYASDTFKSSDVSYDNKKSGLTSTTLQGAIDELNTKAKDANKKKPLCRRATELEIDYCGVAEYATDRDCTTKDGYEPGSKITFGNLGTAGVLNVGDEFRCDVDGDGKYTEVFHYLSDYYDTYKESFDSNYAVLMYNNTTGSSSYSSDESLGIPDVAIKELPTTSKWKNTTLANVTRKIKDGNGNILTNSFSYSGYAARLPLFMEIEKNCGLGLSNLSSSCRFLLHGTSYHALVSDDFGYFIEYADGGCSTSNNKCFINMSYTGAGVRYGISNSIRPVIDVAKTNMGY